MQVSGSSSIISEQQLWKQEGLRNTKTDMAKQSLISSEAWLQLHGLKSNKLTLKQILSRIGFPHCEGRVLTEWCGLWNPTSTLPVSLWGGCIGSEGPSKTMGLWAYFDLRSLSIKKFTSSIYVYYVDVQLSMHILNISHAWFCSFFFERWNRRYLHLFPGMCNPLLEIVD